MGQSTRNDRDRGIILVWFAAFAVVLLGSGALAIDMGALWSERRQLQNGADAAAHAVAVDCAKTACTQSQSLALSYARLNAADNETAVTLCGRGAGLTPCTPVPNGVSTAIGYVQALTSTWNPGSGGSSNQVKYVFAPILDALQVGQTVRASSTVIWGALNTQTVLPMVISKCAFNPAWIAADGSLSVPNTQIEIKFDFDSDDDDDDDCDDDWPFGFDFLRDSTNNCGSIPIQIAAGGAILDAGSEGILPRCRPVIRALYDANQVFVLPIAISRTRPGSRSTYTADGFASFNLCGYALGGGFIANSCSTICTGSPSDFRICGTFKTQTFNSGALGIGTDYGTRILRMIG